MVRPMLGDLDLEQVQVVETEEDQVVTHHPVPSLDGGFLQRLGRRGARLRLAGVLTQADTASSLAALRERFLGAEPVPFVSDIASATLVEQVLVEQMEVRELAGRPARIEYAFTLREHVPGEPVTPEPIDVPPPPLPEVDHGALSVTVVVEGEPAFDFDRVTVQVRGTEDEGGRPLTRFLVTRSAPSTWLEDPFPAGAYTVEARVSDVEDLTGSATTRVEDGETAAVQITLRRGARIALVHIVHFRFDSAFVEPCMRAVLRRVADHAAAHPDERLLVVGHTDLAGSDAYNQSLSERRGRAVYTYLTAGSDPDAALAEWDELRRARPAGVLPSARDTWGTREQQHILADLGYFHGSIGEDPDLTDAAVRRFQADRGLGVDGAVGDATWAALIRAYLEQDALAVPSAQLLPNAADGCDEGPLRWLGCSEQDPVRRTQDAWRPNRRTEVLFVKDAALPCPVPRPVTLGLVQDGAGGGGWCLDDGTATAVSCFVVPADQACPPAEATRWCRRPAEEGSFAVRGRVERDDGTPLAGARYTLTAPDGEHLDGEVPTTGAAGRAGTPVPGRTGPDGTFAYDQQKGPGVYTFEIDGPFVARLAGEPPSAAKGNTVCARLDGSGDLVVVVADRAAVSVTPSISAPPAVLVRKAHTNPARRAVLLQASGPFAGSGTFTRSDDRIRFFPVAAGGPELAFDGVDNVFPADRLAAGHTLFAEAARPSDAVDDVTISLALEVGGSAGLTATATMTAVELTLDVGLSRPAPGVEPPLLPAADKGDPGRAVQVADPGLSSERALLLVRPVRPAGFTGTLTVSALNGRVALWREEVPAAGQVPVPLPEAVEASAVPAAGVRLFVDGTGPSAAARDSGVQLGLQGVDPDGDRVQLTAVQLDASREGTAAAPPVTLARLGVWDAAYDAAGDVRNDEAEAAHFAGRDVRRLHLRVRDAARTAAEAEVDWRTLRADRRTDDDAPASLRLTLPAAAPGAFVSRGVLLVSDATDRDQPTHSGLAAPHPDAGVRARGQSNHRLRRADLDGFLAAEYAPQPGVRLRVVLPVFQRDPDERRRLPARVVRYTNAADPGYRAAADAYIAEQLQHAADRWRQVGLRIAPAATVDRQVPADALNPATDRYGGSANNPNEQAALRDLIPGSPDDTLTIVFVDMDPGANAYATVVGRAPIPAPPGPPLTLGDRFFIFISTRILDADDETLAHELHHVLFNRTDVLVDRQFFTFNTRAPTTDPRNAGIALPDPRVYRRIQHLHAPDPDNDPGNDNILNWVRRQRTARQPALGGTAAPDATTGNTLVEPF